MKLTQEQENIKKIYELFKQSELLDDTDKEFIRQTETIIKSYDDKPERLSECYSFIYNEKWINNWIRTSNFKKSIEKELRENEFQKELREREMLEYLKAKYEGKGKITNKQKIAELAMQKSAERKIEMIKKIQNHELKKKK